MRLFDLLSSWWSTCCNLFSFTSLASFGLFLDLVVPAILAYLWLGLAGQEEHSQGVGLPHAGQQSLLRLDEFIMYFLRVDGDGGPFLLKSD